jgi:hypothetical protein
MSAPGQELKQPALAGNFRFEAKAEVASQRPEGQNTLESGHACTLIRKVCIPYQSPPPHRGRRGTVTTPSRYFSS